MSERRLRQKPPVQLSRPLMRLAGADNNRNRYENITKRESQSASVYVRLQT